MAKLSLINRDQKRRALVKKFAKKREALEAILANPTRLRNRCALTGRARGYFRKFGLSRNKLREFAMRGEVPGVVKASW